jgi:hypothetical protein
VTGEGREEVKDEDVRGKWVKRIVGETDQRAKECTLVYSAVQCSTVQYSTVQYSTVQYSTVQYSAAQYSAVQCSAVQCSTVQCSTVQYGTVQCSTVQYSAVRYSTVQCSIVHSIITYRYIVEETEAVAVWSSIVLNCSKERAQESTGEKTKGMRRHRG